MPNTYDESRVLLDKTIQSAREKLSDPGVVAVLCLLCKTDSIFETQPGDDGFVSQHIFGDSMLIENMLLSVGMINRAFAQSIIGVGIELFKRGAAK